jgi:uncharacterized protein (TIGR03435 family)
MPQLAALLGKFLGVPVSDQTGLSGKFDIVLNVSMEEISRYRNVPLSLNSTGGDSRQGAEAPRTFFSALKELGLKLVAWAGSAPRIVVASATKTPSEN